MFKGELEFIKKVPNNQIYYLVNKFEISLSVYRKTLILNDILLIHCPFFWLTSGFEFGRLSNQNSFDDALLAPLQCTSGQHNLHPLIFPLKTQMWIFEKQLKFIYKKIKP